MLQVFRVLNASYENKRYRVVRVIEGKNYHMVNVPFPYYTDLLNCQWWFIYFINKVDDCGSGRLRQISGWTINTDFREGLEKSYLNYI